MVSAYSAYSSRHLSGSIVLERVRNRPAVRTSDTLECAWLCDRRRPCFDLGRNNHVWHHRGRCGDVCCFEHSVPSRRGRRWIRRLPNWDARARTRIAALLLGASTRRWCRIAAVRRLSSEMHTRPYRLRRYRAWIRPASARWLRCRVAAPTGGRPKLRAHRRRDRHGHPGRRGPKRRPARQSVRPDQQLGALGADEEIDRCPHGKGAECGRRDGYAQPAPRSRTSSTL